MLLSGSYTKTKHGNKLVHSTFKCKNYSLSRGNLCAYPNKINYDDVYEAVNNELTTVVSEFLKVSKNKNALIKKLEKSVKSENSAKNLQRETDTCKRRIEERTTAISQLYIDKAAGVISEGEYAMLSAKFKTQIAVWEEKLKTANELISRMNIQEKNSFDLRELADNFEKYSKINHRVCSKYIQDILIGTDDAGNRTVEIKWNISA